MAAAPVAEATGGAAAAAVVTTAGAELTDEAPLLLMDMAPVLGSPGFVEGKKDFALVLAGGTELDCREEGCIPGADLILGRTASDFSVLFS